MANSYISQIALSHPWSGGFTHGQKDGEIAFDTDESARCAPSASDFGSYKKKGGKRHKCSGLELSFWASVVSLTCYYLYLYLPTSSGNKPSCCLFLPFGKVSGQC